MLPDWLIVERAATEMAKHIFGLSEESSFQPRSEQELLEILVVAILSSQTSYKAALEYGQSICRAFPLSHPRTPTQSDIYELLISKYKIGERTVSYRFPKTRSQWICDAYRTLRTSNVSLSEIMYSSSNADSSRNTLCNTFKGIGLKQASMILRDARVTNDIAIIDAHILRYMRLVGLCDDQRVSPRNYRVLEYAFCSHSNAKGFSTGVYDQAVWLTMVAV